MKRRSSSLKKHTESNRVMRGAWKTDCEYILELYTEPLQSVSADRKPVNDMRQSEVGCDGVDTRYRIRVLADTYRDGLCEQSVKEKVVPRECSRPFRNGEGGFFVIHFVVRIDQLAISFTQ